MKPVTRLNRAVEQFKRKGAELEEAACRALYDQARLCMEQDKSLVSFCAAMGSLTFNVRFDWTDEGLCERIYSPTGEFDSHEHPEEIETKTEAMSTMCQMVDDYERVFGCTYGPVKFESGGPEITDW